MKLAVVTPTGARPEAFALLTLYMQRQTLKPAIWIVVDDGPDAQESPLSTYDGVICHVHPSPAWKPGQNTQHRNILAGMEVVRDAGCTHVAVMEDDDWYAADYLSELARYQKQEDWLQGEGLSPYFNVRSARWLRNDNERHASLCATLVPATFFDKLEAITRAGSKFIDIALWAHAQAEHRALVVAHSEPRHVGIKGMPGRPGIGIGHVDTMGSDVRPWTQLASWIGNDAARYRRFSE